jgi:hypothetical protein
VGRGLSPIQKQLLAIIEERTKEGKSTSMSDMTSILYPDGWWVGRYRQDKNNSDGDNTHWTYWEQRETHGSLLRSLHRMEERGLIKNTGFSSNAELRWWALTIELPDAVKLRINGQLNHHLEKLEGRYKRGRKALHRYLMV